MDDYDAKMLAVGDARKAALQPLKDDLPFIRTVRVNPAQHLHQGRLAVAILTADRVDLAFADRNIDIAERDDAGKSLSDPPHFQNGSHDSKLINCGRGKHTTTCNVNASAGNEKGASAREKIGAKTLIRRLGRIT